MRDRFLTGIAILLAAATATAEVPIHGRLADADGHGVAGAPVVLLTLGSGAAADTRTGPGGDFTLIAPTTGMWEVEIRPPDAAFLRLRLEPLTGESMLPAAVVREPGPPDPLYPERALLVRGRRLYPAGPDRLHLWRETFWRRVAEPDVGPARTELPVVTGQVVDAENGRPLPGALVWQDHRPEGAVRSADGGRYRVPLDPAADATLRAWTEGYRAADGKVALPGHDAPALALEPAAAIRGRIVDEAGGDVAEAEIHVDMGNHARIVDAWHGRFHLDRLLPGDETLYVLADGYALGRVTVTVPPAFETRDDVRVVLTRGRPGRGRVVDASGAPVADARVRVELQTDDRRGRSLPAVVAGAAESDGEGRFELPHLPAGRPELVVEAPGHVRLRVPGVEVLEGSGEVDLGVLALGEGAAISGRVAGPSGEGVPDAEIFLDEKNPFLQGSPPLAKTDADGRFTIADLRPGTRHDLRVEAAGYPPLRLPKVAAPTAGLTASLPAPARISGRVVGEDGRPIAAARLSISAEERGWRRRWTPWRPLRMDVRPDADGRFTVAALEPGPLRLQADAPGFVSGTRELTLAPGEEVADVELVLERGGVLVGRVLEPDGRPALLHVVAGTHATRTDAEGRFRVAGVPLGEVRVRAYKQTGEGVDAVVDVGTGETSVELRLPGGVEVRGRVTTPDGAGAGDASLRLEPHRIATVDDQIRSRGSFRSTRSEADGGFVFDGVEPGNYVVLADLPGYAGYKSREVYRVEDEALEGLEIRLSYGGALTGRVLGLDAAELGELDITVFGEDRWSVDVDVEVSPDGVYRIAPLAPGVWKVSAILLESRRSAWGRVVLGEDEAEAVLDLVFE